MQLFSQVSDKLRPLSVGRSVLAPPGSITTCLAACPSTGPGAWHGTSSNTCPQQLICQSAASAGSGEIAPNIPTFHGFSAPTTMSWQEPRHAGQKHPGCALPALLSAGFLLPPPFFGGSLSTLKIKGCQVRRCWKSSGALPHMMLMGYHLSHPALSPPLCLCSLLAAPGLFPYTEIRENVLLSECPSKDRERPARLGRTLSCPSELTCMAMIRTTDLRHPCRTKRPSAPSMKSPQECAGFVASPGPLLSIM